MMIKLLTDIKIDATWYDGKYLIIQNISKFFNFFNENISISRGHDKKYIFSKTASKQTVFFSAKHVSQY